MSQTRRTKAQAYREELYCDCGGLMEFTGRSTLMHPPSHEHKCRICDSVESVHGHSYPRIVYEYEEPEG